MQGMASQMEALDDFVTKARSQNGLHHEAHLGNLRELVTDVRESYAALQDGFSGLNNRVQTFQDDSIRQKGAVEEIIAPFTEDVRQPLTELRNNIQNAPLNEYKPTGTTPPRTTYEYPTVLPRTEPHGALITKLKQVKQPALSPLDGEEPGPLLSPSKTRVYNDAEDEVGDLQPTTTAFTSSNTGLREVDINVVARPPGYSPDSDSTNSSASLTGSKFSSDEDTPFAEKDDDMAPPPLKKQHLSTTAESKLPQKIMTRRMATGMLSDGRENLMPLNLPSGGPNHGRRLRNRPSSG
jgi:kinesin family protein 11